MRFFLNTLTILTALTIFVPPARAQVICDGPPDLTVLTGEQLTVSGAQSEGLPLAYWWFITPPGSWVSPRPDATGADQVLTPDTPGLWSIGLQTHYAHEAVGGGLWHSETCVTVQVSSVVSKIALGAAQIPTDEELQINGHSSEWAVGVTPQIQWQVDGQALGSCNGGPPPASPADLDCTIPGNWLTVGDHTASLVLTDPASGQSSTDTSLFEVIEIIPMSVDFAWNPPEPDPSQTILFVAEVLPVMSESDFTQVVWDLGDGTVITYDQCPLPYASCLDRPHSYAADGWYDVTVTVHTAEESASKTYSVEVGDPVPPPVASFAPSTGSPLISQSITFTFDGSCTGDCQYLWNFDDGGESSSTNPAHQWKIPGSYNVSLTVSNLSGSDSASLPFQVDSCWSPAPPSQAGTCYGGPVTLTAADGSAWEWSTGGTSRTISTPIAGAYWANVNDGTGCWGHTPTTVVLNNCGDSGGDTNLDSLTDAADLGALIAELTDGDGDTVVGAGGGDLTAPGGDVTGDFRIRTDDLLTVLTELF